MPEFKCETIVQGEACIVRTHGYLNDEAGRAVRTACEAVAPQGVKRFIISLADSPVINSPGITALLELAEWLVYEQKVRLIFVGLKDLHKNVFKVVGLLKLSTLHEDENSALAGS
jgi:anti-anti-sigma factor